MLQHLDLRAALRQAVQQAPAVVGWKPGGWLVYSPTDAAPSGVEPEVFVAARGVLSVALSADGGSALRSVLLAQAS